MVDYFNSSQNIIEFVTPPSSPIVIDLVTPASSPIVIDLVTPPSSPIVIDFVTPPLSPNEKDQDDQDDQDDQFEKFDDHSDKDQIAKSIKKNDKVICPEKEFTSKWFDKSSKAWRRDKIFSRKKQLFYYKTNSNSPFTLEDYKVKSSKTNSNYPNAQNWTLCGYIDSTGHKCQEQGIFYEDEVEKNKEYDHEKYLDIHFCEKHHKYQIKELRKRQLIMECIALERQIKSMN